MVESSKKKVVKIGEVARELDIAVETIRMYERGGILLTDKTPTGQRIFNESDVHWINCIRRLIKEQGLNLEGIRRLLALIPCWEIRSCTAEEKEICPVYNGSIKPCWAMKSEVPPTCQSENCHACPVYMNAIQCENLKNVLYRHAEWKYKSDTKGN